MKSGKQNGRWPKIRKFFNDVHLWLGLISGIVVLLICLSGSIYVYNTELREMANPELYTVKPEKGTKVIPVDELIELVGKEMKGKVLSVKIPDDRFRAYQFMMKLKGEDKGEKGPAEKKRDKENAEKNTAKDKAKSESAGRGTTIMIDPYTGKVLGNVSEVKSRTASVMKFMFSLHRWLLLDKIEKPLIGELENKKLGSYISGTATILFTLGVVTGMLIWFPRKLRTWKQGLKVKFSGSWKRTNHDLHNSLGLYACIFLFMMGITGPQWSFEWYREGLRKTLGTYQPENAQKPEEPKSVFKEGDRLAMESLIHNADLVLPYKGDYQVTLGKDSVSAILITKTRTGFFAPAAGDKIWMDRYTGKALKKEIFKEKRFNERVSGSIKAIHVGDVYGKFSKLIYFLACLIATSLPVTGTLIWINKMKKRTT